MTTKSIITANVPTTLTTAYTNSTSKGAVLKAINLNGIGDPTVFNTTTGATETNFFGSSVNPFYQTGSKEGTGFGIPYPVQLTDNRVLLLSLPHFQHAGGTVDYMGGNTLHTQVVEHNEAYTNYPITNITLPQTPYVDATWSLWSLPQYMSSTFGQPNLRAIALSPTVIVVAYRTLTAFRLMRLNILDNIVDQAAIVNIDLTSSIHFNSTTSGAFDLTTVPGDTTKVIVGGFATTNWSIQAFNIPVTGALSAASTLFSTGIASSSYAFAISSIVKTATANVSVFAIAASTAAGTTSARLLSYDSVATTEANKFTLPGTVSSLTQTGTIQGLVVNNLSSNATANGVIALTQSGTGALSTFKQESLTQVATSAISTTLQHTTAKGLSESFQWGDNKTVFVGDTGMLVAYDSAGLVTNLLPATETTSTSRVQQIWIPFNTRPLYTIFDPGTILLNRVPQLYARTQNIIPTSAVASGGTATITFATQPTVPFVVGSTIIVKGMAPTNFNGTWVVAASTLTTVSYVLAGTIAGLTIIGEVQGNSAVGVGVIDYTNTYFPHGFNYGNNYAWNEMAGCWVVGSGGRIYTLNTSGKILSEIALFEYHTSLNYEQSINQLSVTPSGKIVFVTNKNGVNLNYPCWYSWNNLLNTTLGSSLSPIINNSPIDLPRSYLLADPVSMAAFVTCNLAPVLDGSDVIYMLAVSTIATPVVSTFKYDGTTWSFLYNTSVASTSTGAWNVGFRPNFKLFQDAPVSTAFPAGKWRIYGAAGTDTLTNYNYLHISGTSYPPASFGSLNTNKMLCNINTTGYGITFQASSNIHVVSSYDATLATTRMFYSIAGKMFSTISSPAKTGWIPNNLVSSVANKLQFATIAVSRYFFTIALNNITTSQVSPVAYVFDTNTWNTPKYSLTTTGGNWVTVNNTGNFSAQVKGTGIDAIYTVTGDKETAYMTITINDGTNDFLLTPKLGQAISTASTTNQRTTDAYFIPPTYSVKIKSSISGGVSSMLSIVEEA